ncbi:hypothetical protein F2Q70_00031191 [Brassica cretica]|uniref:Uncharacterized protein n=1 Tax=Brassica cretica TaxID=69181 RepID=A0A8S9FJQ5_BRACR|nr:hypothetical protein F2Q70_00031191 [Brassica cretica]
MRFRFNGCKRSRRAGMEAAISWTARRTTASSLGLVSTEWLEAAGAVVSRFEGAFLSVARGARLLFSTGLGL